MTEAQEITQKRIDEAAIIIDEYNKAYKQHGHSFDKGERFNELAELGAKAHIGAAKGLGNQKHIAIFALSIGIKDMTAALASNAFDEESEFMLIESVRMKAEMIIRISKMPDDLAY